jgi:nucleotide-binding universal stress UspA family protein
VAEHYFSPPEDVTPKELPVGRRILVGVGPTDWQGSVTALRAAFRVSKGSGNEVFVVNVAKPWKAHERPMNEGKAMHNLVAKVQKVAAWHAGAQQHHVEMLQGDPAKALVSAAKEHDADLIVIGNGHHDEHHLSRNAAYVVENAPCDVLIVKRGKRPNVE